MIVMNVLKPVVILTWWWSKWSESEFKTLKKYGHHNCWFTCLGKQTQKFNFGNGWPNLHNYAYMHMQIAGSSRQWSSQNHWPWKPMCRHHNLSFILYNNRVMTQKWYFGNVWPNLHNYAYANCWVLSAMTSQNHWPWKPRCRPNNPSFILYLNRVMTQKWNFGNGRPNLHITQFPQRCQLGIIRILDQHLP